MIQKPFSVLLLALSGAALLTGCAAVQEEHQNYAGRKFDITPVVGSVWLAKAEWPGQTSVQRLADYVYERARAFCNERGQGMMPDSGSSEPAGKDGSPATAWLQFRCAAPLKVDREYQPIKLHFDDLLDDEKKGK
ncbi:hypothetical protein [Sutterella sp.]|uniref:hypothetical protein n=1 Tax=Sutterella sp. TaxID=1981025 RepID=UPI0025DE4451|nr:hypothetical protein [uncultured Sutterella sp.]